MKRLAMVLLAVPIVLVVLDVTTTMYLFITIGGGADKALLFPYLYPTFGIYWSIPDGLLELGEVLVTYWGLHALVVWARNHGKPGTAKVEAIGQWLVDYFAALCANWVTFAVGQAVFLNNLPIILTGRPLVLWPH